MVDAAPALVVEGLDRDFGDRPALRQVSLRLEAGETLVVLGPNGAGKTTFVRILAGLLRPKAGKVEVLGHALPDDAWRMRGKIGFAGHEPLLYRELSGRENLRFQARLHGLDRDAAEKRIADLLDLVAMSRRADEPVLGLSRGMTQRLALCRAVLHQPELLLLDEPRTHLDPEGVSLVEPLIGAESGRARVIVTHDVRGGISEGTRALALGRGGIVAYEGPAKEFSVEESRSIYGGEA